MCVSDSVSLDYMALYKCCTIVNITLTSKTYRKFVTQTYGLLVLRCKHEASSQNQA